MEESDVSVLIPAYGPSHLIDACLTAILQTSQPLQTLCWDNGVDHSVYRNGTEEDRQTRLIDQILDRDPDALNRENQNLGFARANNNLAQVAQGDILLFLNCDTEPQPGWLAELVKAFADPEVAVAGSRLVRPNGDLQHAGVYVNLDGYVYGREIREERPTRDVDAVTGACLAIRREVFDQVGGWDEAYWLGYEDVDLCLRVRQAGYRIRYVAESTVMHLESATGRERWAGAHNNVRILNERWLNAPLAAVEPRA